ncbi:acetylcholinesterase [Teratosphaeria nubilosa]|uniref:Carboxylic ester hydrolase n=1 Tax=Teratosphaeria nubilosa TaxID=161662 RepID=A0A6G1L9X4_9PEZI|nr:acetylcholinesterase [Teratosphaeria nubilosa]
MKAVIAVFTLPPFVYSVPHPDGVTSSGTPEDQLIVSTSSGKIHGKVDEALLNIRQFLGVPYAVPPIGDLRWTAPTLLNQPEVVVEATKLPPSCYQYLTPQGNSLYRQDVLQFNTQGLNRTGPVSEDCLTLSVWTPASEGQDRGLPVLIFIYGGGFTTGGEDVPYQIPAQWVNRSPNHIVVSFNYRLNIFGYPNAAGLSQQNFGLLDQRAAVKWVQQNVAAFGGDPDRIVLWGQSAGSFSVDYYSYAYASDPIVEGLIMDSGTAFSPINVQPGTHSNFTFVADHVGCSGLATDPAQQLACMRNVGADTIEKFIATYAEDGTSPSLSFHPVIDDDIVFANYTERALANKQAKIPAIIGTNAQDGVSFVPYHPDGPSDDTAVLAALLLAFFCPATESTRLRQQTDLTTYRYLYSGNFSNISPRNWMGAYHASELPMLMGTHPNFRGDSTPLEYQTSFAMQDAWVAFASDPVNGLKAQDWQVYSQLGANQVRDFGAGVPARDTSVGSIEALCVGPRVKTPLPVATSLDVPYYDVST